MARLSNTTKSNKDSSPSNYLRRGHRVREALLRQMQADGDMNEEGELFYMKEYDKWVPAALAVHKKK